MDTKLLHESAMLKIESSKLTAELLARSLCTLAEVADESNANVAATTFCYLKDNEEVVTRYVPEITLRVRQPNSLND